MKISRAAKFLLAILSFVGTRTARACTEAEYEAKLIFLDRAVENFLTVCKGGNGKVAYDRMIQGSDGRLVDCRSELKRIESLQAQLHAEKLNQLCPSVGASCPTMALNSYQVLEAPRACTEEEKQLSSPERCLLDVAGNFTMLSPDKGHSNCYLEFVHGIIKDLWYNIESVWALLQKGFQIAGDRVIRDWGRLQGLEVKSSDALLTASHLDHESVEQNKKDPVEFVKHFTLGLWKMMNESIKNNFGCREWEYGIPHIGRCLKPMENWACASCQQKLNATCGLIGYLGGEIATFYITGGALGLSKVILNPATRLAVSVGSRVGEAAPSLKNLSLATKARVARAAKVTRVNARLSWRQTARSWARFQGTPNMKALAAALDEMKGHPFPQSIGRVIGAGTLMGAKLASPASQYLKWMDQALVCGFKDGRKAADQILENAFPKKLEH